MVEYCRHMDTVQTVESRTPKNVAGLFGFALSILACLLSPISVLTLGVPIVPGLVCSIIGARRRNYRVLAWLGILISSASISIWLYSCPLSTPAFLPDPWLRSYVRSRGFENIPESATHIRFYKGGILCSFFYARFQMPPQEVDAFFKKESCERVVKIGLGPGRRRILTYGQVKKLLDDALRCDSYDAYDSVLTGTDTPFVIPPAREPFEWYTLEGIRRGKAVFWSEGPEGKSIYYDEDTNTIYYYWHYS